MTNKERHITKILDVLEQARQKKLIDTYFQVPLRNQFNIDGYTPYICIRLNLGTPEKIKKDLIQYIEDNYDNVRITMTTTETMWIDHRL